MEEGGVILADYIQPILLLFVVAATHIHEQLQPVPLVMASASLNIHYIALMRLLSLFVSRGSSPVIEPSKVIFFMGESSKDS